MKNTQIKHSFFRNLLIILVGFIVMVYLFLIMPNLSRQNALNAFKGYEYAHRGLFEEDGSVPENSLVAFQKAIDHGYGIELDVMLTKDQVPIVIHDYTLERLCGEDILVSSLTYEELSQYTLLSSNESIPTLQEALTLINGQVPLLVELKVEYDYEATCKEVAQLLDAYEGTYSVISFSPYALQWFRTNRPEVIRGQLSTDFYKENIEENPLVRFAMTHLLINCLSRPDFIGYQYMYEDYFSFKVCKTLFSAPTASWTITDEDTFNHVKSQSDLIIFEYFLPSTHMS